MDEKYTPDDWDLNDAWQTERKNDNVSNDVARVEFNRYRENLKRVAWKEGYRTGVADAWQSMDYDGGKTPAARINPYVKEDDRG